MKPLEVMQRLAATNARNDKEQILIDAFVNKCDDFFIGASWALDNLISFGVKKVGEIEEEDDLSDNFSFDNFMALATKLRKRELTGHAARDAIHAAANECDVETWNKFYRRILLKDLAVGVDAKTINKVLKKLVSSYPRAENFLIPVFECQLAHDGEDKTHQKKIKGKKLIDTKLDGVRLLTIMDTENNSVQMYSRNGQTIDTFPELYASLDELLKTLPGSMVLDGEIVSPNGFQHLMTLIKRKEVLPDTALIRYALFDVIPLADFKLGHCKKTQANRHEALVVLQSLLTNKQIFVVPKLEVDLDTEQGQQAFKEFQRQTLQDGYEGVMVKDPNAPYEGKRSANWLKIKPVLEVTLEVVDTLPGNEGKYQNTLGSLVCHGIDNGMEIHSNVSGGISDDLRDQLWKDRDNLVGMMVEIIADKLTLEEGSNVYSLRFPRLKAFRGRVPGEKL